MPEPVALLKTKTFLLILTRIFYEIDSEIQFLGLLKSSQKLFLFSSES